MRWINMKKIFLKKRKLAYGNDISCMQQLPAGHRGYLVIMQRNFFVNNSGGSADHIIIYPLRGFKRHMLFPEGNSLPSRWRYNFIWGTFRRIGAGSSEGKNSKNAIYQKAPAHMDEVN